MRKAPSNFSIKQQDCDLLSSWVEELLHHQKIKGVETLAWEMKWRLCQLYIYRETPTRQLTLQENSWTIQTICEPSKDHNKPCESTSLQKESRTPQFNPSEIFNKKNFLEHRLLCGSEEHPLRSAELESPCLWPQGCWEATSGGNRPTWGRWGGEPKGLFN